MLDGPTYASLFESISITFSTQSSFGRVYSNPFMTKVKSPYSVWLLHFTGLNLRGIFPMTFLWPRRAWSFRMCRSRRWGGRGSGPCCCRRPLICRLLLCRRAKCRTLACAGLGAKPCRRSICFCRSSRKLVQSQDRPSPRPFLRSGRRRIGCLRVVFIISCCRKLALCPSRRNLGRLNRRSHRNFLGKCYLLSRHFRIFSSW